MVSAVSLRDLTITYDRHPAVHHVSGDFPVGSMTGIVGPNGAGKSTLLNAIAGLLKPHAGEVRRAFGPRDLAYLPQQSDIDRTFPISVLDVVLLGLWPRIGAFGRVRPEQREEARAALEAVGLAGFDSRTIASLSAGQFQRVLFARTMVQDCRLILLDEPFNALDARTTADLLRVLHRWNAENRTLIAVLHDLDQVKAHFPSVLLLSRRCLAWGETSQVLTADNLRRARVLAENWDDTAGPCPEDR